MTVELAFPPKAYNFSLPASIKNRITKEMNLGLPKGLAHEGRQFTLLLAYLCSLQRDDEIKMSVRAMFQQSSHTLDTGFLHSS